MVEVVYHKSYKGTTFEHHSAIVTDNVAETVKSYDPLGELASRTTSGFTLNFLAN